MPTTPPIPQRVIDASRRLVAPARVLGLLARVLEVVGGMGAVVLAGIVVGRAGIVLGLVTVVVLAVPAVWLHHAASTFGDVVHLPEQLQSLRDGTPLVGVGRRDLLPSNLRAGGVGGAARTVARTAREVADAIGPVTSAVEVAAPPFWIWTAAAAVAAPVVGVVAVLVLGVELVRLVATATVPA